VALRVQRSRARVLLKPLVSIPWINHTGALSEVDHFGHVEDNCVYSTFVSSLIEHDELTTVVGVAFLNLQVCEAQIVRATSIQGNASF
jgi:hypothetical protein